MISWLIPAEGGDKPRGRVSEKMASVNHLLKENKAEYKLQICAGVYQSEAQADERQIFELADSALYEAKQTGKARSVIYRAPSASTDHYIFLDHGILTCRWFP